MTAWTNQSGQPLTRMSLLVRPDGSVEVTVDDAPLLPPPGVGVWGRESFAAIVDQVTHHRTIPVEVQVVESDGTVFTDTIHPTPHRPDRPQPTATATVDPAAEAGVAGFAPGEVVSVAVIVAETTASPDGTVAEGYARLVSGVRELVFLGRRSGTFLIDTPT